MERAPDKDQEVPPAVRTPAADTPASTPEEKTFEPPKKKTIGERIWHGITYTGIGYGLNLILSLAIWDFVRVGRGRPLLDAIARSGAEVGKALGANPFAAQRTATTATDMAFSTMGGHITMWPVKKLEDHARYITHKLNQALDKNYEYKDLKANWDTPDSDLPPLVDEPHRNTWGQIALRRGLGMGVITVAGTSLEKAGLADPLQNWTQNKVNRGIANSGSPALQRFGQIPIIQRYIRLAALDAYFTVITSMVTALTKQTFGKSRDGLADEALSVDLPGLTTNDYQSREPAAAKSFAERYKKPAVKPDTLKRHESYTDRLIKEKELGAPEPSLG